MSQDELILDHRARREQLEEEAARRRERALIDQRSPDNPAQVRVRIWEQLHQVRMPRDPGHAVLPRIAEQTGLTLADVLEVQRLRA